MAIDPKSGHRIGKAEIYSRLSKLTKATATQEDIDEHIARLKAESDRGVMILAATMLDDALRVALMRTMPTASKNVKDQIFTHDGPMGTFSKRILLAEGIGMFSPAVARQVHVIRRIRNAAAHAHADVSFAVEEVKQPLATVLDNDQADDFETWPAKKVRNFYLQLCGYIADHLIAGNKGLVAGAESPEAIHAFYRAINASDLTEDDEGAVLA